MTTTTGAQTGIGSDTESSITGSQSGDTTGREDVSYERIQEEASRRAMQVQRAGQDAEKACVTSLRTLRMRSRNRCGNGRSRPSVSWQLWASFLERSGRARALRVTVIGSLMP